jgi:hypothetical protein
MRPLSRELSGREVDRARERNAFRPSIRSAMIDVISCRRNQVIFGLVGGLAVFAYTILLPYDFTQRLSTANWAYLSPDLFAWSVALGAGIAFVVVLQIHATARLAAVPNGTLGGLAFVVSLLPSFLCCTPILPTVLALLGFSATGLFNTSIGLQHFFAVNQTPFLVGSLVLLIGTGWMGLRKLATSCPTMAPNRSYWCSPASEGRESCDDSER